MDHCVVQRLDAGRRRRADQLLVHLPAARGDLRPARVAAAARASPCPAAASAACIARPAARLHGALAQAAGDHSAVPRRRREAGRQEPHLARPLGGHRGDLGRGRDQLGLDRPLPARLAASPTTCAGRTPTTSTTRSTGRCRSARAATSTTASGCACWRCGSRCASSASCSTAACPRARTSSTTRTSRCRRRKPATTRWSP